MIAVGQPGHIDQIKQTNAGAVYRLIDQLGPISRIELSKRAQLAPASITKIVRELLEAHLVKETEYQEIGSRGRPAVGLVLDTEAWHYLSARISRGSITLALRDLSSKLVVEELLPLAAEDPEPLLKRILTEAHNCLNTQLLPALAEQKISVLGIDELNPKQLEVTKRYFSETVFPVLTPLAFDPGHPFPLISNLSKNFAVVVRHAGRTKFARVKVPDVLPRFIQLPQGLAPEGEIAFVFLEDIIRANIQELFPGTQVKSAHLFRVIRDADLEFDQEEADDLLEAVELELRRRRFGDVVRVEVSAQMSEVKVERLRRGLDVEPRQIYQVPVKLDLAEVI